MVLHAAEKIRNARSSRKRSGQGNHDHTHEFKRGSGHLASFRREQKQKRSSTPRPGYEHRLPASQLRYIRTSDRIYKETKPAADQTHIMTGHGLRKKRSEEDVIMDSIRTELAVEDSKKKWDELEYAPLQNNTPQRQIEKAKLWHMHNCTQQWNSGLDKNSRPKYNLAKHGAGIQIQRLRAMDDRSIEFLTTKPVKRPTESDPCNEVVV